MPGKKAFDSFLLLAKNKQGKFWHFQYNYIMIFVQTFMKLLNKQHRHKLVLVLCPELFFDVTKGSDRAFNEKGKIHGQTLIDFRKKCYTWI